MFNSGMVLLVISIIACLVAQTICVIPYPNLDEDTNCPLNVNHVCKTCAEEQNRYGCYCETATEVVITASIFTRCPADIVDPCVNHSCKNGAGCVREGLSGYKCNCTSGYGGAMCEIALPKCSDAGITCPNGECVETTNPLVPVFCQCYDGTRRDPQQNDTCPISPCYVANTNTPVCEHNGTCFIVNNAPICQCTGGFGGQNCSKALKTPLCESQPGVCGEGRCQQSLTPPYYSCNCGLYPSTFGKTINELTKCEESGCYASSPCLNGGTCSNKGQGGFLCLCPPRYTGSKCEKQSACYSNPCLNQGVCEAFNETTFFCNCPPYHSGQRCEIKLTNPCLTKTCGPFGQCRDNQGTGVCLCNDGLHLDGSPCQDPCVNKSCNTGVCIKKANATYEAACSCPVNRQGDICEIPRDVCRESPRCGGGYCIPNYASNRGYSCVCEGGGIKAEPCPYSPSCPIKTCGTKGLCVETNGIILKPGAKAIYYVCSCEQGYITNSDCDQLLDTIVPGFNTKCGPNGKPYPSRNPGNPVGCWCNNGTHVEEIDPNGPTSYCV